MHTCRVHLRRGGRPFKGREVVPHTSGNTTRNERKVEVARTNVEGVIGFNRVNKRRNTTKERDLTGGRGRDLDIRLSSTHSSVGFSLLPSRHPVDEGVSSSHGSVVRTVGRTGRCRSPEGRSPSGRGLPGHDVIENLESGGSLTSAPIDSASCLRDGRTPAPRSPRA